MVRLEDVPTPLVSLGALSAFVAQWLQVSKSDVRLTMPTSTVLRAEVTLPWWRKLPVLRERAQSRAEDAAMAIRAQFVGSQDIEVVIQ